MFGARKRQVMRSSDLLALRKSRRTLFGRRGDIPLRMLSYRTRRWSRRRWRLLIRIRSFALVRCRTTQRVSTRCWRRETTVAPSRRPPTHRIMSLSIFALAIVPGRRWWLPLLGRRQRLVTLVLALCLISLFVLGKSPTRQTLAWLALVLARLRRRIPRDLTVVSRTPIVSRGRALLLWRRRLPFYANDEKGRTLRT